MIDVNKLKGLIVEKGFTQKEMAKILGISSKTFYGKMSKGKFYNTEMEKMIAVLDIEDPAKVFFADFVA